MMTAPTNKATNSLMPKEIWEQIMADMEKDLTKLITTEMTNVRTKFTSTITNFQTTIHQELHDQITEVLKTIQVLNQCFTDVMDHLPPIFNTCPQKTKGLGITN